MFQLVINNLPSSVSQDKTALPWNVHVQDARESQRATATKSGNQKLQFTLLLLLHQSWLFPMFIIIRHLSRIVIIGLVIQYPSHKSNLHFVEQHQVERRRGWDDHFNYTLSVGDKINDTFGNWESFFIPFAFPYYNNRENSAGERIWPQEMEIRWLIAYLTNVDNVVPAFAECLCWND